MKMRWVAGALLLGAVALAGCGQKVEEAEPAVDDTRRLGEDSVGNKLADWLELPCAELAELAVTAHDRLKNSLEGTRIGTDIETVILLPKLRMPFTVPVLAEAVYSAKAGISLPPYFKEGSHDPDLALHLARHGDVDAALKVADPTDTALVEKLEACRASRNYPVEWARLVALSLQEAELGMAKGDVDGATELVWLHRHLRSLLDKKAAAGHLGADLLPLGQRALRDAVVAWRESDNKFPAVAEELEATLKDWGDVPVREPELAPGAARAAVASYFSTKAAGPVLATVQPPALQRLLDLQNLPIVSEKVIGALAFFDKDQLGELWFVYRHHIGELFPETLHLAHYLVELGVTGKPGEKIDGLARQSFPYQKLVYDFTLIPNNRALGAVVRVANAGARPIVGWLPQHPFDLGGINLGRTFENTRFELAPRQASGPAMQLTAPETLAQVQLPFPDAKPASIELDRFEKTDLIGRLIVRWPEEENLVDRAFEKLCLPLWLAYGPGRFGSDSDNLILTWEQLPARVMLLLPTKPGATPEYVIQDTRGAKETEERLKDALTLDEQARQVRWAADKRRLHLQRFLGNPELQLGLPREQANKSLPPELKTRTALKTADGSFSLLVATPPPATAIYFPLQLVLRFGPDDKLAQIRIRYQEGPGKPSADKPALLDVLKKANGLPVTSPAPWLGLWWDRPTVKTTPVYHLWQDDRTILTYQADAVCSEVILTDCPKDEPQGVPLKRLDLCSHGPDGCWLGDSRQELLPRWQISKPTTTADGGLVLFQPATSPYDLAVVYFEKDRVVRVLARHRGTPASVNEDFTKEINRVWLADLDRLGIVPPR